MAGTDALPKRSVLNNENSWQSRVFPVLFFLGDVTPGCHVAHESILCEGSPQKTLTIGCGSLVTFAYYWSNYLKFRLNDYGTQWYPSNGITSDNERLISLLCLTHLRFLRANLTYFMIYSHIKDRECNDCLRAVFILTLSLYTVRMCRGWRRVSGVKWRQSDWQVIRFNPTKGRLANDLNYIPNDQLHIQSTYNSRGDVIILQTIIKNLLD